MATPNQYVQTNTFYLAGSGVLMGAVTATVNTLTDIYGNILSMADFGTKGYITFEPDTTNEEGATFTGITANTNGTFTFTGVKTVMAKSPYTETSGLVRNHNGNTKVVVTDNVAFWNTFANKANDETITGQWTFTTFPVTPTNTFASATVAGITKLSVAPASPSNPIAVGINDPIINPTGVISMFSGSTAPAGWMIADGSAISRTTYATLFGVVGTTYGAGDGSTTFNIPNLKGNVPVGLDASQTEFNALAKTGGEKSHVLTTPEIPAHTHTVPISNSGNNVGAGGGSATIASGSTATSSVGGGGSHNNLQPYIVINYIIKT